MILDALKSQLKELKLSYLTQELVQPLTSRQYQLNLDQKQSKDEFCPEKCKPAKSKTGGQNAGVGRVLYPRFIGFQLQLALQLVLFSHKLFDHLFCKDSC